MIGGGSNNRVGLLIAGNSVATLSGRGGAQYVEGKRRFLFHLDKFLPDHPYALTLHFVLHGIHHYLPMDRYRLVMPPALFLIGAQWTSTFGSVDLDDRALSPLM
ncbi:hypothetical protein DV735_g1388, partial [Chaetothyriales sp. CBS 134920]